MFLAAVAAAAAGFVEAAAPFVDAGFALGGVSSSPLSAVSTAVFSTLLLSVSLSLPLPTSSSERKGRQGGGGMRCVRGRANKRIN